ncbi:hypothetical protein BO94DRAFT_589003 [Aspergillus sclerotioniger CBS 115572]|uniref:Uncharacterized protein n=1 Tax=Aspergillus sclerotioniger CBS 115572 TaxID=1450535 RepID=A0A317VS66_9EURO|nr:hypothetical protein BO94DRAFT_589003 [Aspergillus sclerotioniger CBS 115572]PWY76151.1 hypothetical protein BO94DRAFT_589003 [Aspergillus sclerotioniger CBS 115572]
MKISIFRKCRDLLLAVNSIKTPLLEIDELHKIGIQAIKTEMNSNEQLNFQPCFFQPLDSSALSKYPLLPGCRTYDIDEGLTYESCLGAVLEENPNEKHPEEKALKALDKAHESIREWGPWLGCDLRRLDDHITSHLECHRAGIPEGKALEDLTPLRPIGTYCGRPPNALFLLENDVPGIINWQIVRNLAHRSAEFPHTIGFFWNEIDANDQTLTLGELRGILRWTVSMYYRPGFGRHLSYPLLSIWYMGPKHGRIIQSHHDGQKMILQYSSLMSFEDIDKAPTSLFVRYGASSPVGTSVVPTV